MNKAKQRKKEEIDFDVYTAYKGKKLDQFTLDNLIHEGIGGKEHRVICFRINMNSKQCRVKKLNLSDPKDRFNIVLNDRNHKYYICYYLHVV